MISNIKIFLLCPVPEDQKPINEYIGLKENSLTNWTTLSKRNYQKKLLSFWSFFFFFITVFRILEVKDWEMLFRNIDFFVNWVLINFLISLNFFFFFMFVNYVRWKQIKNRFTNSRLFYEEASWYDGQIWEKPFSIIKNDRLVSTQKMLPILERLTATLFSIFYLDLILFPIFYFI
jgi:Zn-dependent protease with chaperone function